MSNTSTDFKSWLKQNTYGNYNGINVTQESELVSYTYVISLVVVTFCNLFKPKKCTWGQFIAANRQ